VPEVHILTEADLRGCVTLDAGAIDIIDRAFATFARGGVVMPPILSMAIVEKHGEVDVKTAYVPGLPAFAIKVSPGFFDNPKKGLPSLNGLMMLLDSDTGIVRAVLLDNGYLTDVRTAAAGGVAARHLAPRNVDTVGVIGAGVQADLQVRALRLEREFRRLVVWARDPAKAASYARRMRAELGITVEIAAEPQAVVAEAQVVITTTPASEPLIRAEWLHPGLHITAMGSDAPGKNELDPAVLTAADRFICDRATQSELVGELRSAVAAGLLPAGYRPDELGDVCAGIKPGRLREDEITVCDLTGTGLQDTAIATHAYAVAVGRGFGQVIES
jgi:ectoine utilization protein EutC